MLNERAWGIGLLSVALLFMIIFSAAPLGESWVDDGTNRESETYALWAETQETAPSTSPGDPTSSASVSYFADGNDGTGGITYLRAMGPITIVAFLLTVAALVFTAAPRTTATRMGGYFALPAAVLFAVSIVLAVVGLSKHAAGHVDAGAQIDWSFGMGLVTAVALLCLMVAAGMGLVPVGRTKTVVHETWTSTVETHGGGHAGRHLQCPDCDTVIATSYGIVPICPSCGFGGDYDGPYGPPVPAQASTA